MNSNHRRTTWVDRKNRTWRVEYIGGRWQLSLWQPTSDSWLRIGSYPGRQAAIHAAYEQPD
jgi:hypothetical protein